MATASKYPAGLVEYLEEGRLKPALVVREQGEKIVVQDGSGLKKAVARELILVSHPERRVGAERLAEAIAALQEERAQLAAELDLNLLWEVAQEQGRSFTAAELAELFFGRRSSVASSVMLEALFNDRVYFIRRHLEFLARTREQVERLRTQNEKVRMRSEEYRRIQNVIRAVLADGVKPEAEESAPIVEALTRYLKNPSTRSNELSAILTQAVPEADPAETAFEILDRLGAPPPTPRFATIGGLRTGFSAEALREAAEAFPAPREMRESGFAITIDDEETLEVDDALSCEELADGAMRVRIHIALVSDFVKLKGAMDLEAGARAATVYLPEATVLMLPEEISCRRASLIAGEERPTLTTEATLSADGELIHSSIYPARIRIAARLDYDRADRMLDPAAQCSTPPAATLRQLHQMALKLRERRRRAGAALITRNEAKVKVRGGEIEIKPIDNSSPSRQLVAEFMVLSNYIAARFAAQNAVPLIYRVQTAAVGDPAFQKPRLSLYPEHHAGVALDYYAQLSSPLRRYADLVLQRQLIAALCSPGASVYRAEELLTVVASMESTEAEGKELERRAKRYWILRYLSEHEIGRPLEAQVTREGMSAELSAYAVRGALRGGPNLVTGAKILVEVGRLDPLRGWLNLRYLGPSLQAADAPPE